MRGFKHYLAALLAALSAVPANAQPQRIDGPGPMAHEAAATTFPERIGAFRRTSVVRYGSNGQDLSAGYNLVRGGTQVAITIYIYPALLGGNRVDACRREFDMTRRAIASIQQGVRPGAAVTPRLVNGADPALSHRATFTFTADFAGTVQPVTSQLDLYCFVRDAWTVKVRATAPAGHDVDAIVTEFIDAGPWPGRAPAERVAAVQAPVHLASR